MQKKKITNLNEEFDFKLFAIIAKKNFYWLFTLITLGLIFTFLYLRYTPPVFQAQSLVKIDVVNNASAVLNIRSSSIDQNNSNLIAGHIELIRSRVIVGRALAKLPLQISYYAKGTVLVNELYTSNPYKVEALVKDSSVVDYTIYVEFLSEKRIKLSYTTYDKTEQGIFSISEPIQLPEMTLKFTINNFPAIVAHQNTIKKQAYYFIINDPETNIYNYSRLIQVQLLNQQAQTLQIVYKDNNPYKAADIVNMIVSEFNDYDKERKSGSETRSLEFINESLGKIDQDLKFSEYALESFKKDNKILNPAVNAAEDLSHINESINQKALIQLDISVVDRLKKDLDQNKDINNLIPILAGTYADNVIASLITNIQALENEKQKLKLQATDENMSVKNIQNQIQVQRQLLLNSIKNARESLQAKIENIDIRISEFEKKFLQLPSKEAELNRLQRMFDINQKFYSLLLEKKVEFAISIAGVTSNNVVLEKAAPSLVPISPIKKFVVAASLSIAFLIGMIIIFFKYLFYNEITSLEEINQYTEAALLGIVPKYKNEIPVSQLLVDKNPKSAISESFRSIRTNLQFIANEPSAKVIGITSTISGEGKTFVAINLAGVIAFSDKTTTRRVVFFNAVLIFGVSWSPLDKLSLSRKHLKPF